LILRLNYYESHKYYNGNLYVNIAKDVKNQQLFMDLHANIVSDVEKNQQLLWNLYASIAMDVKKPSNYYETYMWVLHIWNGLMEIILEKM
jgi:hypothetical protein